MSAKKIVEKKIVKCGSVREALFLQHFYFYSSCAIIAVTCMHSVLVQCRKAYPKRRTDIFRSSIGALATQEWMSRPDDGCLILV